MLLRVGYGSAKSWEERRSKWKVYQAYYKQLNANLDEKLYDYPGKVDGRRDMSRDFRRAEQRATWSGDVEEERRDLGLYTSTLLSLAQEQKESPNAAQLRFSPSLHWRKNYYHMK